MRAEIKAVPDLNLESDRKLDKLESFLGKLNSKGESCCLLLSEESNLWSLCAAQASNGSVFVLSAWAS